MDLSEIEARERIAERIRRAQDPHLPTIPRRRRRRLASQLRRIASQLDG